LRRDAMARWGEGRAVVVSKGLRGSELGRGSVWPSGVDWERKGIVGPQRSSTGAAVCRVDGQVGGNGVLNWLGRWASGRRQVARWPRVALPAAGRVCGRWSGSCRGRTCGVVGCDETFWADDETVRPRRPGDAAEPPRQTPGRTIVARPVSGDPEQELATEMGRRDGNECGRRVRGR